MEPNFQKIISAFFNTLVLHLNYLLKHTVVHQYCSESKKFFYFAIVSYRSNLDSMPKNKDTQI